MKKILFMLLALSVSISVSAAKKTVLVVPEDAKIFLNGMEVGTGSYTVNFDKNTEFVNLRFEAPGYIERTVKLLKSNPNKTVSYTLYPDEAYAASVGDEDGFDQANKWFTVTCKEGMTDEVIWKRLTQIAIDNFEQLEVKDKAAGWIRSGWTTTRFPYQTVRTRLEIRIAFGDENVTTYRVRVESEIKNNDCKSNNCWRHYDRLLKKYEDVIQQLQTTLGSNN